MAARRPLVMDDGHLRQMTDAELAALAGVEFVEIPPRDITLGGFISVSHGLSDMPKGFTLYLRAKVATLGFSAGALIAGPTVGDGYSTVSGVSVRLTSEILRINIATGGFWIVREDTRGIVQATASQWEFLGWVWA